MSYDVEEIDTETLDEARSLLNARWIPVIDGYIGDATNYIENIRRGYEANDKKAIASNAHPLKSASLSLGAAGLGKLAEDIENSALEKDSDINDLENLISLLESGLEKVGPKLRGSAD